MNNENCEIEVKKPRTINKTLKGKKYYNSNKERTINKTHGQATKSARGMPWHWEPKKDGANTEMLRGAVSMH